MTMNVSKERRTSSTSILAGLEPKYAIIPASRTPWVMMMTDSMASMLEASRCRRKRAVERA